MKRQTRSGPKAKNLMNNDLSIGHRSKHGPKLHGDHGSSTAHCWLEASRTCETHWWSQVYALDAVCGWR